MKVRKKTIFFVLIGLSVLGIPVFAFGIFNTMISLKYETNNPTDCISLVTGQDLCLTLQILKGLAVACLAIIILLIVFRRYFLSNSFTSDDLPN
jgi:ABC-type Mn2+/Zn2+ transport system permease subunit